MDVTQALRDAENTLRDFIAVVLSKSLGSDWIEKSGVSEERIKRWQDRKTSEEKRQESGVVEERLLYYADFYDLKTILKKHWSGEFSAALGDWRTMEVWLTELEKLRDPDAHRRELLPHQKHLVLGMSGEIRTRLIRYRSKQETSEDYFPRIESARDSLGNIWTYGMSSGQINDVLTGMVLRVGDTLDFTITATDPLGEALQYGMSTSPPGDDLVWQQDNAFSLPVTIFHVGKTCAVQLSIRTSRKYHARGLLDDTVSFFYTVLPPKD